MNEIYWNTSCPSNNDNNDQLNEISEDYNVILNKIIQSYLSVYPSDELSSELLHLWSLHFITKKKKQTSYSYTSV